MVILVLVLLGLCMGSFVNALVWRIYVQSKQAGSAGRKQLAKKDSHGSELTAHASRSSNHHYSIMHGRSMCVHCEHELAWYDLLPVVSWLLLRGKCRYCRKPIHWQYPAVEVLTAVLFVASYIFWPMEVAGTEVAVFSIWLVSLVGLVALAVYDLKWMLLPNRLIFPMYGLGAAMVLLRWFAADWDAQVLLQGVAAVLVGGGIFYILFQVSKGTWIGGGDVKLGFLLGALLGTAELTLLMLFTASLLGSLYSVPLLLTKRAGKASRIPFGPFLILATFLTMLFGAQAIDWYLEILVL